MVVIHASKLHHTVVAITVNISILIAKSPTVVALMEPYRSVFHMEDSFEFWVFI